MQWELLITKPLGPLLITNKSGLSTCLGCQLDKRHLIDYDLLYPRMAIYHYGMGSYFGLDFDYQFSNKFLLKTDLEMIFIPEEKIFLEHKFLFNYFLSDKYIIRSGYIFSFGYYPFNKENGLWNVFPLIDFILNW